MFRTRANRAAGAYAAMRALDPNAKPRAELLAAGVSKQRIASLYPGSDWESLLPHLSEHILAANPDGVAASGMRLREAINGVADRTPTLNSVNLVPSSDSPWRPPHNNGDLLLVEAILECMQPKLYGFLNYGQAEEHAVFLARACWWAWRIQLHRGELKGPVLRHGDRLMLTVAHAIGLA